MKNKFISPLIVATLLTFSAIGQDTFSIVAIDTATGEVGSAGASCVDLDNFPGITSDHFIGDLLPGVGAINTQAAYDTTNQNNARNRMMQGDNLNQIIAWLTANDATGQASTRQYGLVYFGNGSPSAGAFTGNSALSYAGQKVSLLFSIQGNILLGPQILDSMQARFMRAPGDLKCRLMAALQGANVVGADSRCGPNGTSSLFAYIKVAQPTDAYGDPSFVLSVRTATGDGIEPIDSLQTLFDQTQTCIPTSINTVDSPNNSFSIYPNPTRGRTTITNQFPGTYQTELVDLTGRVLQSNVLSSPLELDLSNLSKGIYLVRLSSSTGATVLRVVKD